MRKHFQSLFFSVLLKHRAEEEALATSPEPFLNSHDADKDQLLVAFVVKLQVLATSVLQLSRSIQVFDDVGFFSIEQTQHALPSFNVTLKLLEVNWTLKCGGCQSSSAEERHCFLPTTFCCFTLDIDCLCGSWLAFVKDTEWQRFTSV